MVGQGTVNAKKEGVWDRGRFPVPRRKQQMNHTTVNTGEEVLSKMLKKGVSVRQAARMTGVWDRGRFSVPPFS